MKKEIKNIKNIQLITCVEKTAIRGGKKGKDTDTGSGNPGGLD